MSASDGFKKAAAEAALSRVEPGMKLGLGTGSTAEHFIRALGARVRAGLDVIGVPTSDRTAVLAAAEGIRLTDLDSDPVLDLDVDGADEVDGALRLIKGGGGALLREKVVAAASRAMIVIADEAKMVGTLGRFPLPVEVIPFGLGATVRAIMSAGGLSHEAVKLRLKADGTPFVTDGGHHIVDASFGRIPEPEALSASLNRIPGVVEHGLFIGLASAAAIAGSNGVKWLEPVKTDHRTE